MIFRLTVGDPISNIHYLTGSLLSFCHVLEHTDSKGPNPGRDEHFVFSTGRVARVYENDSLSYE